MPATLHFSKYGSGSDGDLASVVEQACPLQKDVIDIATHAIDYRQLVDKLAACRALNSSLRTMLEGSNFVEDVGYDHWSPSGNSEGLRTAICALWRSNIAVRLNRKSARLHANVILSQKNRSILLTSANLTSSELTQDHNSGVKIVDSDIYSTLHDAFGNLWRGQFENNDKTGCVAKSGDGSITVYMGANIGIEEELRECIDNATKRVWFSIFSFSSDCKDIIETLSALQGRGVNVGGVVDGDQFGQSFDAVPVLRSAGIDARYVPGVLTGGKGRMHHKLFTIDDHTLAISTYNLSASARDNYEIAAILRGPNAVDQCAIAQATIDALHQSAFKTMPSFDSPLSQGG